MDWPADSFFAFPCPRAALPRFIAPQFARSAWIWLLTAFLMFVGDPLVNRSANLMGSVRQARMYRPSLAQLVIPHESMHDVSACKLNKEWVQRFPILSPSIAACLERVELAASNGAYFQLGAGPVPRPTTRKCVERGRTTSNLEVDDRKHCGSHPRALYRSEGSAVKRCSCG